MTQRYLWLAVGHLMMVLGLIGVFLPVMPTAPFVIAASYAYSRGSPRFEKWLLEHPRLGPPVKAWREHGIIRRTPKVLATIGLTISVTYVLSKASIALALKITLVAVILPIMIFVWSRPERPES